MHPLVTTPMACKGVHGEICRAYRPPVSVDLADVFARCVCFSLLKQNVDNLVVAPNACTVEWSLTPGVSLVDHLPGGETAVDLPKVACVGTKK